MTQHFSSATIEQPDPGTPLGDILHDFRIECGETFYDLMDDLESLRLDLQIKSEVAGEQFDEALAGLRLCLGSETGDEQYKRTMDHFERNADERMAACVARRAKAAMKIMLEQDVYMTSVGRSFLSRSQRDTFREWVGS